jgi:predicted ATPase
MIRCDCAGHAAHKKIVLTGGPGAGKTAVLELVRQHFCRHVIVLPESAGILFRGGFPRAGAPEARRAAQRAIYFVQRELEAAHAGSEGAIMLCDRGTVDGMAYWPGPGDLFSSVGTDVAAELGRYDVVIHLRTPAANGGYDRSNPLRLETAAEAAAIDQRIAAVWAGHRHRYLLDSEPDFITKARRALDIIQREIPACCRSRAGADRAALAQPAG